MLTLLFSLTGLLLVAAFVCTLLSSRGKLDLWIALLLVVLANLIALLGGAR